MSNQKKIFLLPVLFVLIYNSCTAVNQARTVGKGGAAIETSIGGPLMTNLGFALPLPNFYLGGRYGLRDDLDIAAHLNLFTLIIPGILDLLTSASWVPLQPGVGFQDTSPDRGWGAGLGLDIQWVTDFKNGFVALPAFNMCASYRYRRISVFGGSGLGFDFLRPGKDDDIFQICPFLGFELISRKRLSFGVKFTAFDILYNYNGSQTEWIYMSENAGERKKHAPIGVAVGLGYTLKKKQPDSDRSHSGKMGVKQD